MVWGDMGIGETGVREDGANPAGMMYFYSLEWKLLRVSEGRTAWHPVPACAVVQCACTGLVLNPTLLNHGSRYIYRCTCRYWGSICLAHVFSASLLVGMVTHGTEKIYSRGDKNSNSHLSHCQLGHSGMFTPWWMILLSDLNWRRWAGVRATVAWRARVYWLLHTWGANVTKSHATKLCSHLQVLIWVCEDISQPTKVVRYFCYRAVIILVSEPDPWKNCKKCPRDRLGRTDYRRTSDWFMIAFTCVFNGTTNCNTLKETENIEICWQKKLLEHTWTPIRPMDSSMFQE